MRVWLNPDLLQARGLTPQDVINIIQQQSQEVTAGQVGAPPAPKGQDFQYTLNLNGRLDDPPEFENIIVKVDPANGGQHHPSPRRRPRRARRPDLQRVVQSRRPAGRRNRRLPLAGGQRHRGLQRGEGENGRARQELPGGPRLRHPLRHDEIRAGRDLRSLPHADRGGHSGADRHSRLPAGLARDAGAGHDRAGDAHRRLRRHGGARLLGQSADAVRPRAGDRDRGRRRDRHRRRRRALCRARDARPRGGGAGDGRSHRSGPRHHAGPDVGLHSRRFRAGAHRTALPAIRAGHRRHRLHQRRQRPDLEADAIRVVAQAAEAARAAQLFHPRLRRGLRRGRARIRPARRRNDPPRRRRWSSSRSRSSGSQSTD